MILGQRLVILDQRLVILDQRLVILDQRLVILDQRLVILWGDHAFLACFTLFSHVERNSICESMHTFLNVN